MLPRRVPPGLPVRPRTHQQEARGEHPHQAEHDDRGERAQAQRDDVGDGYAAVLDVAEDPARLQTDQQEHHVLEQELDRAPVQPLRDPGGRGLQDRRLVAQQQAGDHHREHSGAVDLLGRHVGDERRDQRDAGVDDRVGHAAAHTADDEEQQQADGHAPGGGEQEVQADVEHGDLVAERDGGARAPDRDGGPQGHQGGRVVEQRLALQDRDDPARDADAAGDRGRRHGVRRRDDRAEGERRRPGHVRDDVVGHHRDADRREGDQPDRQQQDRATVGVEVDQRRLQRRGVQQRRQQPDQHHLGGQVHLGDERQERRARAERDEHDRRGQVEAAAERGDGDDDHRQR